MLYCVQTLWRDPVASTLVTLSTKAVAVRIWRTRILQDRLGGARRGSGRALGKRQDLHRPDLNFNDWANGSDSINATRLYDGQTSVITTERPNRTVSAFRHLA